MPSASPTSIFVDGLVWRFWGSTSCGIVNCVATLFLRSFNSEGLSFSSFVVWWLILDSFSLLVVGEGYVCSQHR